MHTIDDIAILWQMVRDGGCTRCVLSAQGRRYELRVEHDGHLLERAVQNDEIRTLAIAQEWRRRYAQGTD